MPVSEKYKIVFIHNPKTGGSSICDWLDIPWDIMALRSHYDDNISKLNKNKNKNIINTNNRTTKSEKYDKYLVPSPEHLTYHQLKNLIPIRFNLYFKFTFVRNPYDRLVSTYFFRNREFETFSSFVHFVNDTYKKYTHETMYNHPRYENLYLTHILPQYIYIGPNVTVYRFEDFNNAIKDIKTRFNIAKDIPRINTSSHTHYSSYYNEETRKIVSEIYKRDLELFNYTFSRS
jgi:chondroitin 4-sulfotransferase 11